MKKEQSKLDMLNKNLKSVHEKFDALVNCGIDRELLEVYVQKKTGLSSKKVKQMLNSTEDFFNKLVDEEMVKGFAE